MSTQENLIKSLIERGESYSKTTYELSKLKILNTTIIILPALVSKLVVILMLILFTLVLNLGIALYLGELLGQLFYGFFIVAAFYLIAAIVMHYFLNNWIKKPISDLIIKQALQ
jgi:hypothetical protein